MILYTDWKEKAFSLLFSHLFSFVYFVSFVVNLFLRGLRAFAVRSSLALTYFGRGFGSDIAAGEQTLRPEENQTCPNKPKPMRLCCVKGSL